MKKSFRQTVACLLAFCLLFCSLGTAASAESFLLGDLSGDGQLTVTDLILMRICILQENDADDVILHGDLNRDKDLTVTDVVMLRNEILAESGGIWVDPEQTTPFDDMNARYLLTMPVSGRVLCPSDTNSGFTQWQYLQTNSQQWEVSLAGDGYYYLRSPLTGKALTVVDSQFYDSTIQVFQMASYAGDQNQQFYFTAAGDGTWYVSCRAYGLEKCLELPFVGMSEDALQNGWPVWLSTSSGSEAQKVSVSRVEPVEYVYNQAWADSVYDAFMNRFRVDNDITGAYFSGLETDFWKPAELMEMILDCYEATENPKYLDDFAEFYRGFTNARGTNWGFNKYNDDIMWMVIACCRAYSFTQNAQYLEVAKENFDLVYQRSCDDVLGGGIYWTTDHHEKNACINGPAAIAACYLSELCGPVVGAPYLEYAKALFEWERTTLFAPNGRVYDNLTVDGNLTRTSFTYNQGTFIGAATRLYELTNDRSYLDYAKQSADYTMNNKYRGGVLNNENDNGDADGFKGIFARWLYRYIRVTGATDYNDWLALNITTGWENRNSQGLVGTNWSARTNENPGTAFSCGTYLSLIMPYDLSRLNRR